MENLKVEALFNVWMEAMTTKTPGHCDQWNDRYQQLLNNDQYLKEIVDMLTDNLQGDGAAVHNAIYRGKNLSEKYSHDEIVAMISSGKFDDLYIGDYYDKQITTSIGGTETVRHVIADLDTFFNNEEPELTQHHAVIVPKDCFQTIANMNDELSTSGGYYNSKMHQKVLPVYAEALQSANEGHIISHKLMLSNQISGNGASMAGTDFTGYASNWLRYDVLLNLMSEIQLIGSMVVSSSWYDVGERNMQFNLFRHNPAMKIAGTGHNGSRNSYWLSAVVSKSAFAICGKTGGVEGLDAYYSVGVRPYFLIG